MGLGLGEEVRLAFRLATLRREASTVKTGPQWERTRAIGERCERLREEEKKLYRERYLTRVEVARKRLSNDAGKKTREYKPRFVGEDRLDKDALWRQAGREVKAAHRRRLAMIDREEARGLDQEMKRAYGENRCRNVAREDFNKTVDRRTSMERRVQTRKRDR